MMRNFGAFVLLAVGLCWPAVAHGQTTINNTTLSAAITATQQTVSLASVTCTNCTFGPQTLIQIEQETMQVTGAYVGGSGVTANIPVRRGVFGTPVAHNVQITSGTNNVVFVGPPGRFNNGPATQPAFDGAGHPTGGACLRVNLPYLPLINLLTGVSATCDNYNYRYLYNFTVNGSAASRPTTY